MTLTTFLNKLETGSFEFSHAFLKFIVLCFPNSSFNTCLNSGVELYFKTRVICIRLAKQTQQIKIS